MVTNSMKRAMFISQRIYSCIFIELNLVCGFFPFALHRYDHGRGQCWTCWIKADSILRERYKNTFLCILYIYMSVNSFDFLNTAGQMYLHCILNEQEKNNNDNIKYLNLFGVCIFAAVSTMFPCNKTDCVNDYLLYYMRQTKRQ